MIEHLLEHPFGEVHDLLRRPRALDRGVGEGEERVSPLEVLDGLPGLAHVGRVIVGANAGSVEGGGEALDLINKEEATVETSTATRKSSLQN